MVLERKHAGEGIRLARNRLSSLRSRIPAFESGMPSLAPGELLSQDTFYVGRLKRVGKVYLHAAAGTHGSYAFGFLGGCTSAQRDFTPLRGPWG